MEQKDPSVYRFQNESLLSCLEVGKLLTSTYNVKEILKLIMQKVSQLIPAQNWSLLLKNPKKETLSFDIVVGIEEDLVKDVEIPIGVGIAGTAAKTGKPVFVEDASSDERINRDVDRMTGFKTESIIALPLKIHDKILGVIEVINIKDLTLFRESELPTLEILVDYAAIAIENANYTTRIKRLTVTDEYTGLYNARYLYMRIDDIIAKHEKINGSFAVVFVDIDNFKTVVDTHGHLAGSQALMEIGQTMKGCLSKKDILIKYGGDEYVLVLQDINRDTAKAKAEGILKSIRETSYLTGLEKPTNVTASFGISMYPHDASSKTDLLRLADDLMYGAKKSGKNRVEMK